MPVRRLGRRGILCFGDSLTEGHTHVDGALTYRPYSAELDALLSAPWPKCANFGVSGEKTASMKARFPQALRAAQDVFGVVPRVVVILGGTNDLGDGAKHRGLCAGQSVDYAAVSYYYTLNLVSVTLIKGVRHRPC
eukprot:SAG31_NODE_10009_length_1197_cov_0.758652_2_plen_136_part_00